MKTRALVNKIKLLFPVLCSAVAFAQQNPGEWLTWSSASNTISISYPKEWTEKKLNAGEIVAFVAPKTDEKDTYPDMLVLRAFPDSGIKDLARLKDFARGTLSSRWNFKMVSSQKLGTGDRQYIKSVAEDSKRNVVLVMYTFLKNDRIIFLTLNVEKRNYEKYKSAGQRAFDSLEVRKDWIPE